MQKLGSNIYKTNCIFPFSFVISVSIDNLFAFLPFAKLSAQNMGLALGFILGKAQSEHYHEWKNLCTFFIV